MLDQLRRRAPWIALCVILVAGAAYLFSQQQTETYTATVSLLFKRDQPARKIAGLAPADARNPRAQWAANVRLLHATDVAAKTARRLGQGLSPRQVSAALRVTAAREWGMVAVSASGTSARLAAAIANTYTSLLVAAWRSRDHAYYAAALSRVEKKLAALSHAASAGAKARGLRSRARSLQLLDKSRNTNAPRVHAGSVTRSTSSPTRIRNTALGAVLGLMLGLAIALLIERLGRRIRAPEDLARLYRLPLLGIVPRSRTLFRLSRPRGSNSEQLPHREEEAFQLIRARLRYFKIDRELRTVLVASASPGEGKTTIARHLASAAARAGSMVLLVEADLRTPVLAWQLGLKPGPGLSAVLMGQLSLWSATQLVDVEPPPVDGSAGRALDVLAAGVPLPPNPGELIGSQAMEEVLEEARSTYDLVVIDAPPLAAVSDAFVLLSKVDGVIVAACGGHNRRGEAAERLRARLDAAGAPLLGVIANCVSGGQRDVSPGGSGALRHPEAPAKPGSHGHDHGELASNGSSPAGWRDALPRFSSRVKRGAVRRRMQSEDDPHQTARH